MKIPCLGQLVVPWTSTLQALKFHQNFHHHGESSLRQQQQQQQQPPKQNFVGPLLTHTMSETTADAELSDEKPSNIPYFAMPEEKYEDSPPEIPPPYEFDDPVDLAVLVGWVEDIVSEEWGQIENVKPLFYEMGMGFTQVAICVSEPHQNIYVTFRGTDVMEFPDIFANLNVLFDDFGPAHHHSQGCNVTMPGKVQRGWNRKVFNPKLYLPLSDKLCQTKQKYPDFDIIIAGHSLGAALSILYGVYVAKYVFPDERVQVMNLGSPRIGNEEFYFAVRGIPNLTIWRMVYLDDVVPRCPPMWTGYRHVGHLLHWVNGGYFKAYHQQLETCMESQCYAGIDMEKWNIIHGDLGHHEHDNYKQILVKAKQEPEKYWPKGFETL